jgi:hypothetical protein
MRGKDDLFAEQSVVEHEQSTIDELELIVPKNVKDGRPGTPCVPDKAPIVCCHSYDFPREIDVRALIPSQIKKIHLAITK